MQTHLDRRPIYYFGYIITSYLWSCTRGLLTFADERILELSKPHDVRKLRRLWFHDVRVK